MNAHTAALEAVETAEKAVQALYAARATLNAIAAREPVGSLFAGPCAGLAQRLEDGANRLDLQLAGWAPAIRAEVSASRLFDFGWTSDSAAAAADYMATVPPPELCGSIGWNIELGDVDTHPVCALARGHDGIWHNDQGANVWTTDQAASALLARHPVEDDRDYSQDDWDDQYPFRHGTPGHIV